VSRRSLKRQNSRIDVALATKMTQSHLSHWFLVHFLRGILWQSRYYFPILPAVTLTMTPSVIRRSEYTVPLTRTCNALGVHRPKSLHFRDLLFVQTFANVLQDVQVYLDASFCCFPRSLAASANPFTDFVGEMFRVLLVYEKVVAVLFGL
jgi:hypothetical protein